MKRLVERAYEIAKGEIGQKEIPGSKDNPRIIEYLKSVDLNDELTLHDEIAWCSAFVTWCLKKAGGKGTGAANARSYLHWGLVVSEPHEGDIVIFKRGNSSWQGHVGYYISKDEETVLCLSGNTSNQVKIARFPIDNVLGYRTSKG